MAYRAILVLALAAMVSVGFNTTSLDTSPIAPPASAIPVASNPRRRPIPFEDRLTCSVAEAVEATSLCRSLLYQLMAQGVIKWRNVGSRRVLDVRSVIALVRAPAPDNDVGHPPPAPTSQRRKRPNCAPAPTSANEAVS